MIFFNRRSNRKVASLQHKISAEDYFIDIHIDISPIFSVVFLAVPINLACNERKFDCKRIQSK